MAGEEAKKRLDDTENQDWKAIIDLVAKNQDREAFRQIFDYFAPKIKAFYLRAGLDINASENLTQEVLVTIWQKAYTYDCSKSCLNTWVFTIARNKKIDFFRKEYRPEPDPNDPAFVQYTEEDIYDEIKQKQNQEKIKEAIALLPEEQADLIRLSFFADISHSEIAQKQGIPLGTVKSRIRLALQKLKQSMKFYR